MRLFNTKAFATLITLCVSNLPGAESFPSAASAKLTVFEQVKDIAGPENIAFRPNGDILLTSLSSASLYQVSPNKAFPPVSVAQIPGSVGLLGIAELDKNIFYVVESKFTPPDVNTANITNQV